MVATLLKHRGRPRRSTCGCRARARSTTSTSRFSLDADAAPHRRGRGRAPLRRRGPRLHRRLQRRPVAADPARVPRLLRRREHGRGPRRQEGRGRPAHRPAGGHGRGARSLRATSRPVRTTSCATSRSSARSATRAGRRWCCRCRAAGRKLHSGDALRPLRRRQPLERPPRPRPAAGRRHRDGGRDAPPRRPRAEPRGSGAPARSRSTVEGLATGLWSADPEVARALGHAHRPLRRRRAASPAARSSCTSSRSAATGCRSSAPAASRT